MTQNSPQGTSKGGLILFGIVFLTIVGALNSGDSDSGSPSPGTSDNESAAFCAAYRITTVEGGDITWDEHARYSEECDN